ncbi:MAG: crossover junction endodeoxyribonuclease RuvC [Candidatus Glassbacteria bacterium]|nr:crossover junction endodeoxyribonuclease RuvC [Candidatus Glassbacteria bacterium]
MTNKLAERRQRKTRLVLGVDPGGEVTGFGVLRKQGASCGMVACGASRAVRGESLADKLTRIFRFVQDVIEEYEPGEMAVEDIFYGRNAQSMKSIGQVRGVIILAGALAGLDVYEYAPREVKLAVAGRGSASKEQVQRMIQAVLGLSSPPEPHDAADALAVALCHTHRHPG